MTSEIKPIHFSDHRNMKNFMDEKLNSVTEKQDNKLAILKKEMNTLINALYEEVANYALSIDRYRVPVHGIPEPQNENPLNLF